MQTPAEENYLKALWHLGGAEKEVSLQALAQKIGATPGAITDMVKRLAEKGYIHYRPYHGAELTEKGANIALRVIRRHRIWETFVSQRLGYTGEKIHALAEDLEHLCDDEFIERLYVYLGRPALDPHGDEIPAITPSLYPLTRLRSGQRGRLQAYSNQPAIREAVLLLGLQIGELIEVIRPFPVDGALWVRYYGREHVLPPTLAENLFVDIV
ncbi:MAG: metal-dependent transcriptional regulator [Bacteroidia bacterium]|nr:metal-dependent transcriptional regulator [Bacteroidia bacterium]MCX7763319.1 metal-dependent transcriptional regulator [Bacteroidia bacterium]MDW8057098.1 metal-dependent transcriptional regulator [Bacteroidia bacterium]